MRKAQEPDCSPSNENSTTWRVVWIATFVAFTGTWHVGYSIGSVNAAYSPIISFVKGEYEDRYQRNVTSQFVDAIWVTTSAMYPFGGLFGSFFVGPLVRRFGRLTSILYAHVVIILMSFLLGLSKLVGLPELLVIARFGIGMTGAAVGTGICSMYVSEISPKHLRGKLGGMIGTGISLGIFGANALGLPTVFGNDYAWPVLLAFTGAPSLLFIAFFRFLPESPRELFMEKENTTKATNVLRTLNGNAAASLIMDEMTKEKNMTNKVTQLSILQLLRSRQFLPSVITAFVLAVAQQLTGINGVLFNMNNAFLTAGLSNEIVPYASVGVTGAAILLNIASASMTEKFGRKFMICLGYTIEALTLLMMTIFIELQHLSVALPYLTVVMSLGFCCGFNLSGGTVTHVILPELFDQSSRSAGMAFASGFLWLSFTVCVVVTPYMLAAIGGYAFLLFSALAVVTVVFTVFKIPETKNKTFLDIQAELAKKFSLHQRKSEQSF